MNNERLEQAPNRHFSELDTPSTPAKGSIRGTRATVADSRSEFGVNAAKTMPPINDTVAAGGHNIASTNASFADHYN